MKKISHNISELKEVKDQIAAKWDEIIYRGDPQDRDFIAFYVLDGELVAAAGCNHDSDLLAVEYILRDGIALSVDQMRDPDFDLTAHALE